MVKGSKDRVIACSIISSKFIRGKKISEHRHISFSHMNDIRILFEVSSKSIRDDDFEPNKH